MLLQSELLAAAIAYYKDHRDALFRFIDDPLVPIDNSPTEREFHSVAKLRLNMLFASVQKAHISPASCSPSSLPVEPCRRRLISRAASNASAPTATSSTSRSRR